MITFKGPFDDVCESVIYDNERIVKQVKQKIEEGYTPVFDCRYWLTKKKDDRIKLISFDIVDFVKNT